ncbi:MAG: carbon-nitrogen hydrolase family protein [Kiritimatiellae bacterium]|nr:carbon-nitrogen hydrolase family protein [Verrucomicrobiota bacterium]MBU4366349.1 carbon-nitrogen hydrolase family protein [Verrucomicrobiota bacterium]MCG2659472.1 carbon-nitrogen hydrolase family protein [Kiritimatiellia bacterium]
MAKKIKISVIGSRVPEADPSAPIQTVLETVIDYLRGQISQVLPDKPDLIVLPEMCDQPSNFAVAKQFEFYRLRGNRVLEFLSGTAREHHCHITYPAIRCLADGTRRNSVQFIDRRGEVIAVYDKYHPTIGENEAGILSGTNTVVAECDFGRVGFAICFDLNFDEIRCKYVAARPDLMIFCSAYHGGLMQAYWAYSGRMFFAAAISGIGGFILSPVGELTAKSTNYFNYVTSTVNLDYVIAHLDYNWERLSAMRAKYGSRVQIFDPGYLGSVLVSSEADDISARDMAREFNLELLNDYFARSLAVQARHRKR